mmetsp:Transcript_47693/g.115808  ORF Transcript_47693/g.115808 Transcript_47693/m.115808 type:complete len:215 (-) Transcript_47693:143-787(-)
MERQLLLRQWQREILQRTARGATERRGCLHIPPPGTTPAPRRPRASLRRQRTQRDRSQQGGWRRTQGQGKASGRYPRPRRPQDQCHFPPLRRIAHSPCRFPAPMNAARRCWEGLPCSQRSTPVRSFGGARGWLPCCCAGGRHCCRQSRCLARAEAAPGGGGGRRGWKGSGGRRSLHGGAGARARGGRRRGRRGGRGGGVQRPPRGLLDTCCCLV